ncbi:MAG TPA: hypothetical protein VG123_22625 [Streptosporangiaceae bacterium]|jgi:hypothetical protein|nr:hypothetical protein [Streptosporangiaceae bacterium]
MTSPDLAAAAQFLAANARVLERRWFERLSGEGGDGPVRDAVAAYRNPDGGFGHALEPDGRCPGSQPLAIEYALHLLHDAGAWDDGLAAAACDWLAAHEPAGGGAVFVDPSVTGWPHAPWWVPEDAAPASLITTGLIAGTLHAHRVDHPWLDRATELLWDRAGALSGTGPYDVRAVLHFLDHVPDRDRARAAVAALAPVLFGQGMVALDPAAPGEVHTPLDFAPLPGSLARDLFDEAVIAAHLDHLAAAQRDDGGWMFNWLAWSPAAELEWRGAVTVRALDLLRGNGRW